VWIEPGQTPEQIDRWFALLAEHGMPRARLFIMWNYVETGPGTWDFSLYDQAFAAAERHGVKIAATLTTNRRAAHRGDFYQLHGHRLEDTRERLEESRVYIEKVVGRWKESPALEAWLLTNEAAQHPSNHPLAVERFREWLPTRYASIEELNRAWSTSFASFDAIEPHESWTSGEGYWYWTAPFVDWWTFWREHLTWWLSWIRDEVRRIDPTHPIHTHNQGVTGNLATRSYDFPAWRSIADSLGVSIHPAWAFGGFERDDFALAVAYSCDLMRGASEPKPFWVTELQGGTNLYSGWKYPLTPTPRDIEQWAWTSLASGAGRVLFWLLNDRSAGFETGEWSMLDFQQQPTDRLQAAAGVARVVREHESFFSDARPIETPITIVLSLETMTLDAWRPRDDYVGRGANAHVSALWGYYKAFQELGLPVSVKHIHDIDWERAADPPHLLVLPHVRAISREQADGLETFVETGHRVLVSGLTGLVDPWMRSWALKGEPLGKALGGIWKDVRFVADRYSLPLRKPALELPAHLWRGEILDRGAEVLVRDGETVLATRHRHGRGEATWIPSPIGMGAALGDTEPLSRYLATLAEPLVRDTPFRFDGPQPDCVMRTLRSGARFVTVVTNGSDEPGGCRVVNRSGLAPRVIHGSPPASPPGEALTVAAAPRATSVLLWE
jgi:beta-galactosidase